MSHLDNELLARGFLNTLLLTAVLLSLRSLLPAAFRAECDRTNLSANCVRAKNIEGEIKCTDREMKGLSVSRVPIAVALTRKPYVTYSIIN